MTMMNNEESKDVVVSSGWEDVDRSVATGGTWVKFTDGQTHSINVFGAPAHIKSTFQGKTSDRVRFDVFLPGQGVKIWQMAGATYADLKEEREACREPFGDAVFNVKRNGTGPDTRYRIRYLRQLTAQEVAERSDAGKAKGVEAGDPF